MPYMRCNNPTPNQSSQRTVRKLRFLPSSEIKRWALRCVCGLMTDLSYRLYLFLWRL